MKLHSLVFLLTLAVSAGGTSAALSKDKQLDLPDVSAAGENDNMSDALTRVNPDIDNSDAGTVITRHDLSRYPFLNLSANRIIMNNANWSELARLFDETERGHTVSIVHIGDSHVQPDGNTGQVRKILQNSYGDAGRGLMAPLKIAKTNGPLDFKLTTTSPVSTATLMRMPWQISMGFTGVAVRPDALISEFSLSTKHKFNRLNIYASGILDVLNVCDNNCELDFTFHHTDFGGVVELVKPTDAVTLCIKGQDLCITGFDARNGNPGILYHNIGNNGATYSSYSFIGNMGKHISALTPELIVISLGTNEAFGRITTTSMLANIDLLVKDIRRHNPRAQLLLTTPSECQRSVYTRVRRGRKRRSRRVRSYAVNNNVALVRDAIMQYGKKHNIPVYDFYAVAGGKGASTKWLEHKLMSSDRIHRTWAGYYLEGELFADAVANALAQAGLSKPVVFPEVKTEKATDIKQPQKVTKQKSTKKRTKKKRYTKRRRR